MANITGELIRNFIDECWDRVLGEVCDAAVYIDYPAAECLHWHTGGKGYLTLKNAGALAVQELSMYNFRYAKVKKTKKIVIISTSNDPAFYRRTIKMILAENHFEICRIFCSAHSQPVKNHSDRGSRDQGKLDYVKLTEHVKEWMAPNIFPQEPFVDVTFVPFFLASVSDDFLLTPPFHRITPDLFDIQIASDATRISDLESLAKSFRSFFERINVREDVYSIGKTSDYVAQRMEDLAAADVEQKRSATAAPPTGISFILVDRTLDLSTPTSNDTESFLATILRTLPRLPHHANDVSISLSRLFDQGQNTDHKDTEIPGCLASMGPSMLDFLISKPTKKILLAANQALIDALAVEKGPQTHARTSTRISPHSLQKLVEKLKGSDGFDVSNAFDVIPDFAKNIQMILAVIMASTSEKSGEFELLTSLEKLALQSLSVSGESSSILVQLSNVIRTRATRGLDLENLFPLLIHVYALAGTEVRFTAEHETVLETSVAGAIYEDLCSIKEHPRSNKSLERSSYSQTLLLLGNNNADVDVTREMSCKAAAHFMKVLRAVAAQRSHLTKYRSIMLKTSSRDGARRVGILEQLTNDIVRMDVPVNEFRDLHQSSPSLVSAGFNLLLRGRTKRCPRDNPLIFIYIIGGITPEEAKVVRELASRYSLQFRIIIGGSHLLNSYDVVDKFLLSSVNALL